MQKCCPCCDLSKKMKTPCLLTISPNTRKIIFLQFSLYLNISSSVILARLLYYLQKCTFRNSKEQGGRTEQSKLSCHFLKNLFQSQRNYLSASTFVLESVQKIPLESFYVVVVFKFQTVDFSLSYTEMLQSYHLQSGWAEQWSQSGYFPMGNTGW